MNELINREYFMENASVRFLFTSDKYQKTNERVLEQVEFSDTSQRVNNTKHFPCCIVFIIYILRFQNPDTDGEKPMDSEKTSFAASDWTNDISHR